MGNRFSHRDSGLGRPARGSNPCLRHPDHELQQTLQFALEDRELHSARTGFEVNHQVESWEIISMLIASKDFSHSTLQEVTHDRITHLAAGGDSKPGLTLLVGVVVEGDQRTMLFQSTPIAAQKIRPATHPLSTAETFIARPFFARPLNHQGFTQHRS